MQQVTDLNIEHNIALPSPIELIEQFPRSEAQANTIASARQTIRNILNKQDPRFLVIVGPCSIHDPKAGLEYAEKLTALAAQLEEKLFIVMRVYFEKPRTTVGWKGLIMDPDLDGTADIPEGLKTARRFLRDVLDLGMPTATELLDPITPQYIADLIAWSAIGARTTESQTHRQMASGLSMPLGFKNCTPGTIQPAINAIKAAIAPQTFLGVNQQGVASAVTTKGNPDCHLILRGGDNGPNYHPQAVNTTIAALESANLPHSIMIDASHANCDKDHQKMPAVFREIVAQRQAGNSSVVAAMLESNLVAGNQAFPQPLENLNYGQSITDQCIDWATTEQLLTEAASRL